MLIRDLRRIRPMLDLKTASTIATSIVHAKLDYCNSLFLNIDVTQINRLQAIQNALARAVTKTPKHHHITPVLKKLHWLKIPERIECKVVSLTYKHTSILPTLILTSVVHHPKKPHSTRSSSTLTLLCPSVTSSLKFSNRSIAVAVPPLWNKLPPPLRRPILRAHSNLSPCHRSTTLSLQTENTVNVRQKKQRRQRRQCTTKNEAVPLSLPQLPPYPARS